MYTLCKLGIMSGWEDFDRELEDQVDITASVEDENVEEGEYMEEEGDGSDGWSVDSEEEDDEQEDQERDDEPKTIKRKRKKSSRYPIGEYLVEGHVYGESKNTQDMGFNFRVTKILSSGSTDLPKMFQIARFNALPTYCPFISYRLKISPPGNQETYYTVLDVVSCTFRIVEKKEIRRFIMFQNRMSNGKPVNEEERFKKRLADALKNVPKIVTNKAQLKSITDQYLREMIEGIVGPRFRGQSVLSLLPFFSYSFLEWMDELQSTTILVMVVETPYVFCFWDKFIEVATSLVYQKRINGLGKLTDIKIFPNDQGQLNFDVNNIWAMQKRFKDGKEPLQYRSNDPWWTPSMFKKALEHFKVYTYDPDIIDVVRRAMNIHLTFHAKKMNFRNTILNIANYKQFEDEKKEEPTPTNESERHSIFDRAVAFLCQKKILINKQYLYEFYEKIQMHTFVNEYNLNYDVLLMEPKTCSMELEMVAIMREKEFSFFLYDCPDYCREYTDFVVSLIEMYGKDLGASIFLSSNPTCANYMSTETAFNFLHFSAFYDAYKKKIYRDIADNKKRERVQRQPSVVFLDHFHKWSLKDMILLFKTTPPKSVFHIIGDTGDHGPNSNKGTHHLMKDFCTRFPPQHVLYKTPGEMFYTRQRLYAKHSIGSLLTCIRCTGNKDLFEAIKQLEDVIYGVLPEENGKEEEEEEEEEGDNPRKQNKSKKKKKKKKHLSPEMIAAKEYQNQAFHIFCSDEATRKVIMGLYFKNKAERNYIPEIFKVGDKVHLTNSDIVGRIQAAWVIDRHENVVRQVDKQFIHTMRSDYLVKLWGSEKRYNTRTDPIRHAQAMVLSSVSVPSTDYVIFIAGESTTKSDIQIAAKYARKELRVMMLGKSSIESVDEKTKNPLSWQYISDLPSKLRIFL